MNQSQITFDGDTMRIDFQSFDQQSYATFLKAKRLPEYRIELSDEESLHYRITAPARFAPMMGIDRPAAIGQGLLIPEFLYDDQSAIVEMALEAKRFACWSGCGNGKTLIGEEFVRQVCARTGGRVLIITRPEIVNQWLEESEKFYGKTLTIVRLHSRAEMKHWCETGLTDASESCRIAIVNHEKFIHKDASDQVVNECRHLAGVVLDEASILKAGGGKIKWALIKSCRGILYKLALTATPAPNEIMEFASQASWLEKLRDENEIIWTYFRRDEKTHRWTVKKHARQAFFEFMSGWSIYVRDPRRYGWRESIEPPPEPIIKRHEIQITPEQRQFIVEFNARQIPSTDRSGTASMFANEVNATSGVKLSQAAKGFVYQTTAGRRATIPVPSNKPAFVADLIVKESKDLQVLVWTVFDAESQIIAKALESRDYKSFDLLTGATPKGDRVKMLDRFRRGESRVLISRASMLGYGMNLQHCGSMIFSGWTFSYEQFYQALRRAYRHGQTRRLRVHIPAIPELEGQMYEAICRKDQQHEMAIVEMENQYIKARDTITGGKACAA